MNKKQAEQVAIFRYGVIAPALHMSKGERKKYFKGIAGKEFDIPNYGKKKYKMGTFKDWLYRYKNGGLDNLKPIERRDKGIPRKMSERIVNLIKEKIKSFPELSASGIYRLLLREGNIRPGEFGERTLRKHIKEKGMRENKEVVGRKKFEKKNVNELWTADFMHGPYIKIGRKKKKTYLCAIIDDHSRMIVGWGWYFHENCASLAMTLKSAISTFGLCLTFYCDNGKVFISNYLHLICAKLGIALVHSKPYDSPSRGKVERFFRTVREKFLASIDTSNITLEELNALFEKWLDEEYHKEFHAGINARPIDRYFDNAAKNKIKTLSNHELDNAFLNLITRKVRNDATVSINGVLYEVPVAYIGKTVELSFPIDKPDERTLVVSGEQVKRVNLAENADKPHTGIHFKDIGGQTND